MDILLVTPEGEEADFVAFLGEAGHTVSIADSALFALDYMDVDRFDAIIVDAELPKASGFDLVARLKLRNIVRGAHTPVMMLIYDHEHSDRAIFHGADSCIFKAPLDHLLIASGISADMRHETPDAIM